MLHPSMSELLTKIDNRYLLVNVTAKRARELAEEAEAAELSLTEKPVKLALDDIMSGRIVPRDGEAPQEESAPVVAEEAASEEAAQDMAGAEEEVEAEEEAEAEAQADEQPESCEQ